MGFWRRRVRRAREIAPDEIFLDSSNLPQHEASQFEGRVAPPISSRAFLGVGVVFIGIALIFGARAFTLEIVRGATYAGISRENTLERTILFATRGLILDRNGRELAWNDVAAADGAGDIESATSTSAAQPAAEAPFAMRRYTEKPGFAHLLGFIQYPKADAHGAWWREEYAGMSGVELAFDATLKGKNGSRMVEKDAHGALQRENIVALPQDGTDIMLTIDTDVQSTLYKLLLAHAARQQFVGGAAVLLDVRTGDVLALVSFPEYDNNAFASGIASAVRAAGLDERTPLLNRATSGLYTPGSIVKPIFAAAALNERIISPDKEIVSTGAITIPNPYDPDHPSVFRDWAVHGPVDMRMALAVSSDEYFYTIGGGHGGQRGLGIAKLDEYARLFGLGSTTGIALLGEADGVIPTPAWKEQVFGADDPWRIGDTYHTVIGQYGFQVTALQAARFIAAIANGGKLLTPQIAGSSTPAFTQINIPEKYFEIVREGMRMAVTSTRTDATVKVLNIPKIHIAAKTGTAQIGMRNEAMHSWSVGFWPAENPHYAYAVVLENAPAGTLSGAAPAMLPFFQWLAANHPEYLN